MVVGGSVALLLLFVVIEAATAGGPAAAETAALAVAWAAALWVALRWSIRLRNVNIGRPLVMAIVIGVLVLMRLSETFQHKMWLYGLIAGSVFAVGLTAIEASAWFFGNGRRRDVPPRSGWHPPTHPSS
jgi:hypothetical protein